MVEPWEKVNSHNEWMWLNHHFLAASVTYHIWCTSGKSSCSYCIRGDNINPWSTMANGYPWVAPLQTMMFSSVLYGGQTINFVRYDNNNQV